MAPAVKGENVDCNGIVVWEGGMVEGVMVVVVRLMGALGDSGGGGGVGAIGGRIVISVMIQYWLTPVKT